MPDIDIAELQKMKHALEARDPGVETITPVQPVPEPPFEAKNGFRTNVSVVQSLAKQAKLMATEPNKDPFTFLLGPTGLSFRGLDEKKALMVDVSIPSTSFQDYNFSAKKPILAAVRLADLGKVLGRAGRHDKVSVDAVNDELVLDFTGSEGRKRFTLPFVSPGPSPDDIPWPNFSPAVKVWMLMDRLRSIVKDTDALSAVLGIGVDDKSAYFFGRSEGKEVSRVTLEKTDVSLLELTSHNPASSTYAISYLKPLLNTTGSEDVVLEFGANMPVSISMGLGIRGGVMARCVLAPVIGEVEKESKKEVDEGPNGEEDEPDEDEDLETDDDEEGESAAEPEEPPAKTTRSRKKK